MVGHLENIIRALTPTNGSGSGNGRYLSIHYLCPPLVSFKPPLNPLNPFSSTILCYCLQTHYNMQISMAISPLTPPQLFPFHQPIFHTPKPHGFAFQTHVNPLNSFTDSGLLSTIGVEEEYRRARSQVNRKGVDLEGYSIEGISVGGQETCVIVPEFKCAFDIGRCPSRAIQQNFVFITHAHLDHIVSFFT